MLEALLQEHDPGISAALEREKIDVRDVHAEVRQALGTGDDRMWEGILVTPRVRSIIARAEEQASGRELEPLDLFEALRAEGGSLAARILRGEHISAR